MRLFRSVAFKLSVLSSLLVLVVIGAMARRILVQIEASLVTEMRLRAEFFARSCREALFPKLDSFALHFAVQEVAREKAVTYAAVLGPDGEILSHSDSRRVGGKDLDPLVKSALAAAQPLVQRAASPDGKESFDVSVPVVMVSRRVGTARLGFDSSSVREALAETRRRILIAALFSIALASLGTTLIVRWIIRVLPRLAEAARQVGRGNFNVQVECPEHDEIGTLARAFNEMTIANGLLFTAIREEKEKLETVFGQTREGLVLTDVEGKFLLVNEAARKLLSGGELPASLGEALAGFECRPPLKEILGSPQRVTPCDFTRREPKLYILAGAAERLGEAGQPPSFVFIFHDATIERREEELSRNFLSIVSHKLRTPLMVVMGFLDIVREEPERLSPLQLEAFNKMERNVELLRTLVEKLLTYTTAQSKETLMLQRQDVALPSIVEEALNALAAPLEESGARVRWAREAMSLLPKLRADPEFVKEALKCLIENAVKFNPGESREVRIDARQEGGVVRVSVGDNGPGIAPEERHKLFRKFYQIDDDFTGQTVGMGLGLAFVKNVAEAHGGAVGVSSKPGEGSEFYFTLPCGGGSQG
ncbi:MAG: ATP-binding protein [Elusimicrobiota bacterium]